MKRLPSPVTWIGGKGRLLPHLLPLLEPQKGETCYVEPFGGSGVVMLNKVPHLSETYNDTDGDLVNLFRVIRDPDGVVHLWWELINTPVAREEFGDALKAKKNYSPENDVKRAAQFVIRCRQRFGGGHTGEAHTDNDRSWGTARGDNRGMNCCVSRWLGTMMSLPQIHRRFVTVVVDKQDAVRCVEQWSTPSTLFYVDPPYVGTESYYQGGFGLDDHKRLANALNRSDARVVLSYYPTPLVDKLYPPEKWHRTADETHQTASGNAPRDPNGKAQKLKACAKRTELILTNFNPQTRRRL
jgi:DNA adenine methylase